MFFISVISFKRFIPNRARVAPKIGEVQI